MCEIPLEICAFGPGVKSVRGFQKTRVRYLGAHVIRILHVEGMMP